MALVTTGMTEQTFTPAMSAAPYEHPLNLTTQAILSYGSWIITFALLALAIRKDRQYGTPFFTFLMFASMVAALAEPLYDVGFMLLFYVPGMWTTFTAFDIPQPVWAYSGYVVLYSGPAMYLCEAMRRGIGAGALSRWAILIFTMSATFEIIGIRGGAYTYWGPHAFRILDYPLAIGVLETAQVVCFSFAAATLRRRARRPMHLLGLFVIFPCTFYMANFGLGAPLIIALHLQPPSPGLVAFCSALSVGLAVLAIRAVAALLPTVKESA